MKRMNFSYPAVVLVVASLAVSLPGCGKQLERVQSEAGVRPKDTARTGSDSGNRFVVRSRSRIYWRGLSACSKQSWFPSSWKDHEPPGGYGAVCSRWTPAHDD